jgi:hypothetical protein
MRRFGSVDGGHDGDVGALTVAPAFAGPVLSPALPTQGVPAFFVYLGIALGVAGLVVAAVTALSDPKDGQGCGAHPSPRTAESGSDGPGSSRTRCITIRTASQASARGRRR